MLTADNARWILLVLMAIGAALGIIWHLGRNTYYWDDPARDLDQITPDEAAHWDTPRPGPVVWSHATGTWVCAAPAPNMPKGICGWPAATERCPAHGALLTPGPDDYPTGGGR